MCSMEAEGYFHHFLWIYASAGGILMWEAGAMMHFLQVTTEGGEKKRKKKSQSGCESLLYSLGLNTDLAHTACLGPGGFWRNPASSLTLGWVGIKSGSWVFFPFFRVSFYLCCCVGLAGSALQWGSSTFLFQGLQGKIFVASLLLLWSWRLLLSLPCTNLYPAHDIDLKNGLFSSDPHLPSSWVWHIPSWPPCLSLANFGLANSEPPMHPALRCCQARDVPSAPADPTLVWHGA